MGRSTAAVWTDHPVYPVPTPEQVQAMSPGDLQRIWTMREEAIRLEVDDPYLYGLELDVWKSADSLLEDDDVSELVIMGGNRAGKSEYAAKRVVRAAMENPGSTIWCFQTTTENSIQMQQRLVYKYLPKALKGHKRKGRGADPTNISFTQKNGFSENKLVFPNSSEIIFRNYMQDTDTIQGGEVGCLKPKWANIGIWADELIPQSFVKELRSRMATRDSKMIITFTPVRGYSPTVKEYLTKARTLFLRPSPVLNGEHVQFIQKCVGIANARIIYFSSNDNPFGGWQRLLKDLQNAPRDDKLLRFHGIPNKAMTAQFPRFREHIHVIRHEHVPQEGTNWHVIDPAGGKNWFMIWVRVAPSGTMYVYREWPDISYGEWARPGAKKSVAGDAQEGLGWGISEYCSEIRRLERYTGEDGKAREEEIHERLIDSRLGAEARPGEEGTTTIMNALADHGMLVYQAPGHLEDIGIQAINSLLAWNEDKERDVLNQPKLFISEKCQNLIYCMTEYSGTGGKNEPEKDPIDVLRYAATYPVEYIDTAKRLKVKVGTY